MEGGIIRIRDIRQLPAFTFPQHFHSEFVFNNTVWSDMDWMNEQVAYIDQLTERQRMIIFFYTIHGDKLVNRMLRKALTQEGIIDLLQTAKKDHIYPLRYQHEDRTGRDDITPADYPYLMEYVEKFIYEFEEIIRRAPKPTKPIKVFRGLSSGQHIIDGMTRNRTGKQYYYRPEFISTTFYLPSAVPFMNGNCCLLELTLEPGTECLLTAHVSRRRGEYEITLGPRSAMVLQQCKPKFVLCMEEHYETEDVFNHPERYHVPAIRMCGFNVITLDPSVFSRSPHTPSSSSHGLPPP